MGYPSRRPRYSARTIRVLHASLAWYRLGAQLFPEQLEEARPRTRGDCEAGPRPCPWVGCKYSLYLDVAANGNIKLNHPELEPGDLEHSCALDLADGGGMTLDEIGRALNLTRERVRQITERAGALMHRRLKAVRGVEE